MYIQLYYVATLMLQSCSLISVEYKKWQEPWSWLRKGLKKLEDGEQRDRRA
jgi:hypothetical protein